MLTHTQIWSAIDSLAAKYKLSPSGLAKQAGLDPTTFNKSKRAMPNGKLRWPSTESISKILAATGANLEEFVALATGDGVVRPPMRLIPMISLMQAQTDGLFGESGFPIGHGWDQIPFPELDDEHAYALEISGDGLLPIYRDGDRIVVSPIAPPRRGDRVMIKTMTGDMHVCQLARLTAQRVELKSLNPASEDASFAIGEIAFMHRIVWASQ